jgi:hypothetical protein
MPLFVWGNAMFGFLKKGVMISEVGRGNRSLIKKSCGKDYVGDLSIMERGELLDNTLSIVGDTHGKKIETMEDAASVLSDIVLVAFLCLARKFESENNILDHLIVVSGMVKFVQTNPEPKISLTLLAEATAYAGKFSQD